MRKFQSLLLLLCSIYSFSQEEFKQKNEKALELIHLAKFEDAKLLLNEVLSNVNKTSEEYATATYILGEEKMILGNYNEALKDFNIAKKINEEANRIPALVKNLNDIGITYWKLGNKESAIENLKLALITLENTTFKKQLADTYNNLGLILSQDQPEKSLEYYNKALTYYESEFGPEHPNYLITKNNIGIGLRNTNKSWDAIKIFKDTKQEWTKMYGENNPIIAFSEANIGQAYHKEKEFNLAKNSFTKALAVYKSNYGNHHPELANTYLLLANNNLSQKKYKNAILNIDSAIYANQNIENKQPLDKQLLISSLQEKAEIYIHRYKHKSLAPKDIKKALITLNNCSQLIEEHKRVLLTKKDKITLGNISSQIYDMAIECILVLKTELTTNKKYYTQELFSYIEKSKGAVLLESMQDAQAKKYGDIPEYLLKKEKKIIATISTLENRLAQSIDEKESRKELNKFRSEYQQFVTNVEANYPDYYELKYNAKSTKLSDIQSKLKDSETMINYYISERNHQLITLIITKKGVKTETLSHTKKFKKWMIGYKNSIQFSNLTIFKHSAFQLYKRLGLQNTDNDNLIIIPHSYLNTIPFEALITKKPKQETDFSDLSYLIQSKSINYHFSATLWNKSINKDTTPSLTYFAPVNFEKNYGFNDLPGTLHESNILDSLFNSLKYSTKGFLKEKATETTLQNHITGSILHLPTHGSVNVEHPELSCIYLYPDKQNDGILYSGEIYNLQLNYNLVTLSACETGRGKISKGEGIIGLSRALLYAGARNIIVSYWEVNDLSTNELMADFYTNILTNQNYRESLKQSKIKMIKSKKYSSPYFWAPFILISK